MNSMFSSSRKAQNENQSFVSFCNFDIQGFMKEFIYKDVTLFSIQFPQLYRRLMYH